LLKAAASDDLFPIVALTHRVASIRPCHGVIMRLLKAAPALVLLVACLLLTGCVTTRQTEPQRTATEQMLLSTAADRAAAQLDFTIPKTDKVFLDASNFEGYDSKYAIGTIRDHILRQGYQLMNDKNFADAIIEIRSGALSTDEKGSLVGIPSFDVPVPLNSAPLTFPEIAIYKREDIKGIAKFAATAYGAKDGKLIDSIPPRYGAALQRKTVTLFVFSSSADDFTPPPADIKGGEKPKASTDTQPEPSTEGP